MNSLLTLAMPCMLAGMVLGATPQSIDHTFTSSDKPPVDGNFKVVFSVTKTSGRCFVRVGQTINDIWVISSIDDSPSRFGLYTDTFEASLLVDWQEDDLIWSGSNEDQVTTNRCITKRKFSVDLAVGPDGKTFSGHAVGSRHFAGSCASRKTCQAEGVVKAVWIAE